MKILYVIHQFFREYQTGTEKVIYNIAKMSQKFGSKVKVVTFSAYPESYYDTKIAGILVKEFVYNNIPVLAFRMPRLPQDLNTALHNPAVRRFAEKIIEKEAPDIIHVGHPMRVTEFIHAAIEMKVPYLITLTDFFLLCPKVILAPTKNTLCLGPEHGKACRQLCPEFKESYILDRLGTSEKILSHAKRLITPSFFSSNITRLEFPNLDITTINHGIQHKHIKHNTKSYFPKDRIIFGYAGTINQYKGIYILLKAFTSLPNKNIALRIYGSGDEEYVKNLQEITKGDSRVSWLGAYASEALGDIFTAIDVFVIPSTWYETYSLVLHEAFASHVPVIGTDLGGMTEKIIDGFNGFTFQPGSIEDLQNKMLNIINNVSILNNLKENIKKDMIIPTIEQEGYKYFRIYKDILDKKKS